MAEFNLESLKIPVISGINDAPLPPNFLGNGRGCNGAYYVDKFNALVEYVTRYWERAAIKNFTMSVIQADRRLLVGQRLVDFAIPAPSLDFSFEIEGIDPQGFTANIFTGTDIENLQSFTPNVDPEETFSYFPQSYDQEPNTYIQPTSRFWQVVGTVDGVFPVRSEILSATWSLPVMVGKCERSTNVSNLDIDFTTLYTAPELGFYVDIDFVESDQYLWVMSPHKLDGILLDDILVLTEETQQTAYVYLESLGDHAPYPYWAYRTTTQGFGGVRISLPKY